jgi:hypothetical protein
MGILNVKGLNDVLSVAAFTRSASGLGLLEDNQQKLHTFIDSASQSGALRPGRINPADIDGMVHTLQDRAVLPLRIEQPDRVLSLLYATRNLGFAGADNIPKKVSAVLNSAEQLGLNATPLIDGGAITWHQVQFRPYVFKDILELKITQKINEHARLHISGALEHQEEARDYVQMTDEDTPVALTYMDAAGNINYLFQGVVTNIYQQAMGQLKVLTVEAASFSYKLDVLRRSRSFQRHHEPYSYIFKRINDTAKRSIKDLTGDVIVARETEANMRTGRLILQYMETDWQFLKRLASHFNIGLTPDITVGQPLVYFGSPSEPRQTGGKSESGQGDREQTGPQLNTTTYSIRRDTAAYSFSTNNYRHNSHINLSENDFTYFETQSPDLLRLGQEVTFHGRDFYVQAIQTSMAKHLINTAYTLTTRAGLMQDDRLNPAFAGVSLHGVVRQIYKDQVAVHISEIDGSCDHGAQWLFPFTTVYSSPEGSGLYIMPEIGDSVRIYFPNNKEHEAVAVSAANHIPAIRGERVDPDTKIISNVHGKQIVLTPGGIQIIANGNMVMTLSDNGGLIVHSNKKIIFEAADDIEIKSKSNVFVHGYEGVHIEQGPARMNMKDDISLSANQIKMQP